MDISEEKNAPVIIAIHPDEVSHITTDLIPAMHARAHRSSVPVAIHWDHGGTYEQIITAIKAGFTSVMIDASLEPFEQNVALTRKVVEAAHAVGVQVEGELGTIGANDSYGESGAAEIIYTNVDDAVRFVEQTGSTASPSPSAPRTGSTRPRRTPSCATTCSSRSRRPSASRSCCTAARATPTPSSPARCRSASTRSTSRATSRWRTTTACAKCSAPIVVLREPNAIQPECIAAMKVTAAEKIDLFGAAGKADLY